MEWGGTVDCPPRPSERWAHLPSIGPTCPPLVRRWRVVPLRERRVWLAVNIFELNPPPPEEDSLVWARLLLLAASVLAGWMGWFGDGVCDETRSESGSRVRASFRRVFRLFRAVFDYF